MFIPFSNGYTTKVVSSTYQPYFSKEFVKEWVSTKYPTSFNGSAVRLEGIDIYSDVINLSLSVLDFYSFLTSNLIAEGMVITSETLEITSLVPTYPIS